MPHSDTLTSKFIMLCNDLELPTWTKDRWIEDFIPDAG